MICWDERDSGGVKIKKKNGFCDTDTGSSDHWASFYGGGWWIYTGRRCGGRWHSIVWLWKVREIGR